MKQIFIPEITLNDGKIVVSDTYYTNYIINVLRYKLNDCLNLSANGKIYEVEIEKINKNNIIFSVKNITEEEKSKNKVILLQSIIKHDRFEWLLEKCVEVGVDEIYPLITNRCVVKIDDFDSKKERWDKIIFKALTQSHQSKPLQINNPVKLSDIKNLQGTKIAFDISDKNLTFDQSILHNAVSPVMVCIGPEGGFENEELILLENMGVSIYKLNLPVLRAETAAVVISAFVKMSLK